MNDDEFNMPPDTHPWFTPYDSKAAPRKLTRAMLEDMFWSMQSGQSVDVAHRLRDWKRRHPELDDEEAR